MLDFLANLAFTVVGKKKYGKSTVFRVCTMDTRSKIRQLVTMTDVNLQYVYTEYKMHNKKVREHPDYGKTYGYPPSMCHGSTIHTHMGHDVSLQEKAKTEN